MKQPIKCFCCDKPLRFAYQIADSLGHIYNECENCSIRYQHSVTDLAVRKFFGYIDNFGLVVEWRIYDTGIGTVIYYNSGHITILPLNTPFDITKERLQKLLTFL